jgi:hypothetical protein
VGAGAGAHHCGGGGAAHRPACYAYHHVSLPWADRRHFVNGCQECGTGSPHHLKC